MSSQDSWLGYAPLHVHYRTEREEAHSCRMAKWWRGVILQAIEARLRREPELNKLGPKVIEALARAAMRLVHGQDIRRRIVAKS